ncbi:MAG: hypothetical protein WD607_05685 [Candidatus Paceibacterota bacterium]
MKKLPVLNWELSSFEDDNIKKLQMNYLRGGDGGSGGEIDDPPPPPPPL